MLDLKLNLSECPKAEKFIKNSEVLNSTERELLRREVRKESRKLKLSNPHLTAFAWKLLENSACIYLESVGEETYRTLQVVVTLFPFLRLKKRTGNRVVFGSRTGLEMFQSARNFLSSYKLPFPVEKCFSFLKRRGLSASASASAFLSLQPSVREGLVKWFYDLPAETNVELYQKKQPLETADFDSIVRRENLSFFRSVQKALRKVGFQLFWKSGKWRIVPFPMETVKSLEKPKATA
jgi:hypothetical protein